MKSWVILRKIKFSVSLEFFQSLSLFCSLLKNSNLKPLFGLAALLLRWGGQSETLGWGWSRLPPSSFPHTALALNKHRRSLSAWGWSHRAAFGFLHRDSWFQLKSWQIFYGWLSRNLVLHHMNWTQLNCFPSSVKFIALSASCQVCSIHSCIAKIEGGMFQIWTWSVLSEFRVVDSCLSYVWFPAGHAWNPL